MAPARPASLKVRALQWLAQREHSRQELRDKLLHLLQRSAWSAAIGSEGFDGTDGAEHAGADGTDVAATAAAEVDAVLQWLEQNGHLSNARFAESRVHARQARYGNRRIQQELQQHGVSLDADARQALQQTELSRAAAVWRRKYGAPATDAAGRVRQMRFLVGRGFSSDVVRRVVQGMPADDGADGGHAG
jgi:regulatory protein